MHLLRNTLLASLVTSSLLTPKVAQAVTSAPYLSLNPSVRHAGLGGDQIALAGHIDSVFSNPASLASLSIPELTFSHNEYFIDTTNETLACGFPSRDDGFGLGFQYISDGTFERTGLDSNGLPVSTGDRIRPYSALLQAGYGRKFSNFFSTGFLMKGWTDKLAAQSNEGWAIDTGLIVNTAIPGFRLAAALRNLGPKFKGFALPLSSAFGFSYDPDISKISGLSLMGEYESAHGDQNTIRSGMEWGFRELVLRAGYEIPVGSVKSAKEGLSLGTGFRYKGWTFNYAWKRNAELNQSHLFSLTLGLGTSPEEKEEIAKRVDLAMENRSREKAAVYLYAGTRSFSEGKWDDAVDQLTSATTWDSHNLDAVNMLNLAKEQQKLAITKKLNAINHPETNQKNWIDSGVRSYIKGDYKEAIENWERIPKNSSNRVILDEYITKAKEKIMEADLAKESSSVYQKQIEVLSRNGYTYFSLGQYDDALATWEKVLALDPGNGDAKWALKELKQKKEAGETYSPQKQEIETLNIKALQAYRDNNLEEALHVWKKALSLSPQNIRIKNNIERVESELAVQKNKPR